MTYCEKCGGKFTENQKFCKQCGTKTHYAEKQEKLKEKQEEMAHEPKKFSESERKC